MRCVLFASRLCVAWHILRNIGIVPVFFVFCSDVGVCGLCRLGWGKQAKSIGVVNML